MKDEIQEATDHGAAASPSDDPGAPRGAVERPALIIFDCDGVLIDSEPISLGRLTGGLNRIGLPIDVDRVRIRFAGMSMASIMAAVAREDGIVAPDGFLDALKAETLAAFDRELTAMPGIAEALAGLDVPFCVASSSDPVRLRHSLDLTGLWPLFHGQVFSASEVARGKPFPDLFLHAAARMGAAPESCLVIEDSVPGIRAARAAGMGVLGFTGGGHWAHDRTGADLLAAGAERVLRGHRDLAPLVAAA